MALTEIPFGLSGRVYRSPMPFSLYDRGGSLLEEYNKQHISAVVILVSDEEALQRSGRALRSLYASLGFDVLYLPVPDFGIPPPGLLEVALEAALGKLAAAKNIAVHCNAGIGRTGLFIACMAKRVLKIDGDKAIQWVRQYIPGAVEVPEQVWFVHDFGR